MDTIFTRGPSLNNRLALTVALSVVLIFIDHHLQGFQTTRMYLNSLVSPLQYVASLPSLILSTGAQQLSSQQDLIEENKNLTDMLLKQSEQLQRFKAIETENIRLRQLLNADVKPTVNKMVAELMAVDNNPFRHQIVINKGALDDVYDTQPVIDDRGVVGQVMEVASTNSRVLLISDVNHAIPVRSLRNDIRFIAAGTGSIDELYLEHVPHSVDVKVGDILVSSGLGGIFPEGYPVAIVSRVDRDESRPFARVLAAPLARLNRLKYMMLLWSEPSNTTLPETQATDADTNQQVNVEND